VRLRDEVQHVLRLDPFGDQVGARLARDRNDPGQYAARFGVFDRP